MINNTMLQKPKPKFEVYTIFVGDLDLYCQEKDLQEHFSIYQPKKIKVKKNGNQVHAFINFQTQHIRDMAVDLNGTYLNGKKIKVCVKEEKKITISAEKTTPQNNEIRNNSTTHPKNNHFGDRQGFVNDKYGKGPSQKENKINPYKNTKPKHYQNGMVHLSGNQVSMTVTKTTQKIVNLEKKHYQKYQTYFVLDASGSMSGSRYKTLKADFVSFYESRTKVKANDLFSVTTFNNEATTLCETLPILKNDFSNVLDRVEPCGGTSFTKALNEAHRLISNNVHRKRFPVLIFLSDGEDEGGDFEMQKLINDFKNLKVFVIGFCTEGEEKLKRLANIAHGKYLSSSQEIQLKSVFKTISQCLLTVEEKIVVQSSHFKKNIF